MHAPQGGATGDVSPIGPTRQGQRHSANVLRAAGDRVSLRWFATLRVAAFLLTLCVGYNIDRAHARPNAEPFELHPEQATNEELADVFVRAVAGPEAKRPLKAVVRKWKPPIRVWIQNQPGDEIEKIKDRVFGVINRQSPGLVVEFQLPKVWHSTTLRDEQLVWFFSNLRRGDPKEVPLDLSFESVSRLRKTGTVWLGRPAGHRIDMPALTHAGIVAVRSKGFELTGAQATVVYSHSYQYLLYELPADILRSRGMSRAEVARAFSLKTMNEMYAEHRRSGGYLDVLSPDIWYFEPPYAKEVLQAYRASKAPGDLDSCLSEDFRSRAHSIVGSALSQAMGLDWGARFDALEYPYASDPTDPAVGSRTESTRHPNIELVAQSFRARDYWLLRRYWPLLLGILYSSEFKPGMKLADARPIALRQIAQQRRAFEDSESSPMNCTGLPPF